MLVNLWLVVSVTVLFHLSTVATQFEYNEQHAHEIRRVLFPAIETPKTIRNRAPTAIEAQGAIEQYNRRRLQTNTSNTTDNTDDLIVLNETSSGDSANIVCVSCKNLQYCSILNNFMVQEVYYPNNPEFLGTCRVIEELAVRLNGEIFGVGKTFRDTPQCRSIVMQYLCLFWGSNNTMYRNECNALDIANRPLKNKQIHTQTPPCRSFCVQIAEVCANDYFYFLNICWQISCPPTETFCTPDPYIGAQVVSAGIGCNMPYDANPYANSACRREVNGYIIGALTVICAVFMAFAGHRYVQTR